MCAHVRLVLLLAVQGVVEGSRINHAKLPWSRQGSSKFGIKETLAEEKAPRWLRTLVDAPLAAEKARRAGRGKNRYAAAKLHRSLHPKQQVTGDEQTSIHGADSAEGASLVQNKADSADTSGLSDSFLLHAKVENDKVVSTDTLGHTWKLRDVMFGLPGKQLITKGQEMRAFGSGPSHGIFLACIVGFLVIVCCICYCGVSLLRYGKKAPKAWTKPRPLPKKVTLNTLAFGRRPYIHEGRKVFEWEQSGSTINLYVKVPEGLTQSHLDIKIGHHHLQVGCVGKEPFMNEEVFDKVNCAESGWRLRSTGELEIMLQKDDSSVWPRVLK